MANNSVARKIHAHFAGPNNVWLIEKQVRREADLLAEAKAEIEELQGRLNQAQDEINEGLSQKHEELDALIDEYRKRNQTSKKELSQIRMAAKSLVTQIDKSLED